jgi:hypothetical protein
MSGPYVVTRRERVRLPEDRGDDLGRERVLSQRAVAGLEKARIAAHEIARKQRPIGSGDVLAAMAATMRITDAGGRVELSDGSVVEVEVTTWPRLAGEVEGGAYLPEPMLLERWNAEHGIEVQDKRGSR